MLPRGIRNHNPLNIRRTGKDQWKGLAEAQNDAAFCQFKSLEYGWPALETKKWSQYTTGSRTNSTAEKMKLLKKNK